MKQIKKIGLWCVLLFACIQISGCGDSQTSWKSGDHEISSELTYEKSMDLDYATEFAVDYYENGFTLISTSESSCTYCFCSSNALTAASSFPVSTP